MTIEGRPELQVDWDKEYAKQRKDRMQDAIDDYLQDDKVDPRQTYEEMLAGIQDVIDYHKKALGRATALRNLMMGYRGIEPFDDCSLSDKDKCREYNLREAEYYTKRAKLDALD